MKLFIVIFMVRILTQVLHIFRSGGTSLPGKVANKLVPDILARISNKFTTVLVTGTNGKTTTVRMIAQILKSENISFVTNKSGANLKSGITTVLLNSMKLNGDFKAKYVLLEVDEAAFKSVCPLLKPKYVVVTNFFRDQLDRYGELYKTLLNIKTGLTECPETILILNGDDSFCCSIGKEFENPVLYFGTADVFDKEPEYDEVVDGRYCLYCKNKYLYNHLVYGHLGDFTCTVCDYRRPSLNLQLTEPPVMENSCTCAVFKVIKSDLTDIYLKVMIPIPGKYNIYNAMAALTFSLAAHLDLNKSNQAILDFEIGFGRMEDIKIGNKTLRMVLVKNPTGFNQALDLFCSHNKPYPVAFIINDQIADGTDVSWLWDVNFEKLLSVQNIVPIFYTSGIRGEDMAIRLKYCGLDMKKVSIIKDYDSLIEKGLNTTDENGYFYIFPTYTALMRFRKHLTDKYRIKKFWE